MKTFGFRIEVPKGKPVRLEIEANDTDTGTKLLLLQSEYIVATLQDFIRRDGQGYSWIQGEEPPSSFNELTAKLNEITKQIKELT